MKLKSLSSIALIWSLTFNALAGEIALTFDDAPRGGSALMSGPEKTEKIITALKSRKVNAAAFFVTTNAIRKQEDLDRLKRYAEEGYNLANHSHAHLSAKKVSPDEILHDFFTAHLITKDFDGFLKLYRPPFLHQAVDVEGRKKYTMGSKS